MGLVLKAILLLSSILGTSDSRQLNWYEENGCDEHMSWRMKEMLGCVPRCDEIEIVLAECLSSQECAVTFQGLDTVARSSSSLCCDEFDEYISNISSTCCKEEIQIWEACSKESGNFNCIQECESEEAIPDSETKEESIHDIHDEETKDVNGNDDKYAGHPCASKINALSTCVDNSFLACGKVSQEFMVDTPCNDYWTVKAMCLLTDGVLEIARCCPEEIFDYYECRGCPLDCDSMRGISEAEFNEMVKNGGSADATPFVLLIGASLAPFVLNVIST